jgi:hypothetical protein
MNKSTIVFPFLVGTSLLFSAIYHDYKIEKEFLEYYQKNSQQIFKNLDNEIDPLSGVDKVVSYSCISGCVSNLKINSTKIEFKLMYKKSYLLTEGSPYTIIKYYK